MSIAPPPPTDTVQFLTTALSQRGPNALPYSEDSKWLIRQHLLALTSAFPSLRPATGLFTHNDGRSLLLLHAHGTIPVPFRGSLYNFPLILWLLDHYPRRPPSLFLTPTPTMLVKPHHPFVDPSGLVHDVPYLVNWIYPTSNLVDLIRSVCHLFSLEPPLYSRAPPPSGTNSVVTVHNNNPPGGPGRISRPLEDPADVYRRNSKVEDPTADIYGRNSNLAVGNPADLYRRNGNSVGGKFEDPADVYRRGSNGKFEDPGDVYRRNAIGKILEAVHLDIAAMRREREAEMEGLFSTQAELRRREGEIEKGVREMTLEKEGLEQMLQVVLMNSDVLDGWVRENEGKGGVNLEGDVDGGFETVDGLSRQMLEYTAADLAIEDVIYSLDKGVQEGSITFEAYLKSVRALSREQFFHRATLTKVRAAQVHNQVASMAGRVPQYGS